MKRRSTFFCIFPTFCFSFLAVLFTHFPKYCFAVPLRRLISHHGFPAPGCARFRILTYVGSQHVFQILPSQFSLASEGGFRTNSHTSPMTLREGRRWRCQIQFHAVVLPNTSHSELRNLWHALSCQCSLALFLLSQLSSFQTAFLPLEQGQTGKFVFIIFFKKKT